jgi:hypothetical protein
MEIEKCSHKANSYKEKATTLDDDVKTGQFYYLHSKSFRKGEFHNKKFGSPKLISTSK